METEFWLQVMIRFLPAIISFGLAFIVAADKKSRERWAEWMYQLGNIRSDQRGDENVQRGIRLPFFILSGLLLIVPIRYFWIMSPTRHVQLVPQTHVVPATPTPPANATASATPGGTPEPTATTAPVPSGPISVK